MPAPIIWKPNITNSHLAHFIYFDYYFSQSGHKAFYKYTIAKCIDMLPKRSTLVDQTFGCESIHSQLSIAIFIASRNRLGAQKSLITSKKSIKLVNPYKPRSGFSTLRDIARFTHPEGG